MSASATQLGESSLTTDLDQSGALRLARYCVYPRGTSEHSLQTGFTRKTSGSAFRLVTTTPEAVGELLRVHIQDFDREAGEEDSSDVLARVVSCEPRGNGRFELCLEPLDALRPRFVRRAHA
jgi:hypothetical protein